MPEATTTEVTAVGTKIEPDELDWLLEHNNPGRLQSATNWYKIEAAGRGKKARTATVYIMDVIDSWSNGSREFSRSVAALDVDTIELHVNSPGGDYPEGVAIMNMLRDHKATVNAQVDGLAASAATVILMGADSVMMKPGSQMMIHEASGLVYGPRADMIKMAELLGKTNTAMAELYATKAGGTADEWLTAMATETWYSAQEAVDAGLADTLDASGNEDEAVAARNRFDFSVFAHAGRDKAPAPYTPTAGPPENPNEEDEEMPNKVLVQMATALGIKDADKLADDNAVSKAITEAQAAQVEAAKVEALKGAEDNKPDEDSKPDETRTPSVKIPDGFSMVDKATLESLQAAARRSDAALAKVEERERDATLDEAVLKGKIPNARRSAWAEMWKTDPEGAKAALASLPDNLVPVAPVGSGGSGESAEYDPDYARLYPEEVSNHG